MSVKQSDRIIELTRLIDQRMNELEALKATAQAEQRHLNEDERAQYKKFMDDVTTYSAELELEKEELTVRGKIGDSLRGPTLPAVEIRDAEQRKYPGLPNRELRFESFGDQLLAVARASQNGGLVDRRLNRAITGMSETFPSDGGFLVQTDFSTELIRRVYETSPVVSRVRRIPVGANANGLKLNAIAESSRVSSVWGGIIMYWLAEGGTKLPTHPEFRQMELNLKKVCGLWYATDELLQDSTALSAVATEGFSEALDQELEDVIINGTGAGQPLGIMKSPALVTVSKETGQLADTIVAENIIKMWSRLHSRSMPNAVWLISQSILPQLMTMGVTVGVGGTPMWMPPSGLAGAPYGSLMGRPVFAIENCDKLGDLGDILLADLSQYIVIDKGGPQFASSIHISFTTDQTCFRAVYRCDGQPAWNTTLSPKDGSDAVSPFITLEARA